MEQQDWLKQQQSLYTTLLNGSCELSTHPISGEWQLTPYLKNQFWWGGGASRDAFAQLQGIDDSRLTQIGVIGFGPVQSFLGSGQRLRDWAVASWLCHYLTGVLIYRFREYGGRVLLPIHNSCPLVRWLQGETVDDKFWLPELPNVITGLFPDDSGWLDLTQQVIKEEWRRLIQALEPAAIAHNSSLLDGVGWRVIHRDNQLLWSVYWDRTAFDPEHLITKIKTLHQSLESQKIGRVWEGSWWGGRTSPSAGSLSIWHPGLQTIEQGGTWGLPDERLKNWWESASKKNSLAGLFSEGDHLNSLEMVKRLASVPEIIEPALQQLWGKIPPSCPWRKFPDRSAVAAAWIINQVPPDRWNEDVSLINECYLQNSPFQDWGMPKVDQLQNLYAHPKGLERRNIDKAEVEDWDKDVPKGWESTIEWTVGWRGDGDRLGQWLSGKQYEQLNLLWSKWHLNSEMIVKYGLDIQPPIVPPQARQIELPHILDLSILFGYWSQLLYPLTEVVHDGKVIFAGGDDFLLLGPITEAVSLTTDLHRLWTGKETALTQPLEPPVDGWVKHEETVYPILGEKMTFSLGVVIAQRRIPQSLWHRGLNDAYKKAKNLGRDRVCVRVIFNSGQVLEWVCPWKLWDLLMSVEPMGEDKTLLNAWEKLLFYFESTQLQRYKIYTVRDLIDTLWASVGLSLSWAQVEELAGGLRIFEQEFESWDWWKSWLGLRGFLARQERDREKWVKKFK